MRQAAELPHAFYVGVELHARSMFTRVFDQPDATLPARDVPVAEAGVPGITCIRLFMA
jgi:hypothetical protein